jgi:molecular chaperone DnaJ
VKTYYQILDIPETASLDDIKKAYRQLAKEHHPDKTTETDEKFRSIKEAYDVLKDTEKRILYNKKITSVKIHPARVRKGTEVFVTLKVKLNEIVGEISKTIITTRNNLCPNCEGTGTTKKILKHCSKCNGTGIDIVSSVVGPKRFCSACKGYGNLADISDCKSCNGTGLFKETIKKTFTLNRENQDKVVIKDSGNYPAGGGLPGNLIIALVCENSGLFEISGKNVKGFVSISPAQAVLGDVIFLDVFNALLKITIPPGTEAGSILEEDNIPFGSGKGKLFLTVRIIIPKNPNPEEKGLYRNLLKLQKGLS